MAKETATGVVLGFLSLSLFWIARLWQDSLLVAGVKLQEKKRETEREP